MTPPKGTLDYGVDEKRIDKLVSVDKAPVIEPGHSFGSVTDKITSIVLRRGAPLWWLGGIAITFGMLQLLLLSCTLLFAKGVGVWESTSPSAGASPSSISFGGSVSAMPAR